MVQQKEKATVRSISSEKRRKPRRGGRSSASGLLEPHWALVSPCHARAKLRVRALGVVLAAPGPQGGFTARLHRQAGHGTRTHLIALNSSRVSGN